MVIAVAVWAVFACGAFVAAGMNGWLGPDAGVGTGFCEAARDCWMAQPANTVSNLGFVLAGLAIAWHAARPARESERARGEGMPRGLAAAYAGLVVTLGPGSAAMHATQSHLGGHIDLTSMFLVSAFAATYAAVRLLGRRDARTVTRIFLAVLLAQEVAYFRGGEIPLLMHTGNAAFVVTLAAALAMETVLAGRAGAGEPLLDRRWLLAAGGLIALAFAIWTQAKTGSRWCHPHSLVQGHAIWHLLCAGSAYALYRAYAAAARA